uniref:Uncharacterized protein n=1 Tax=Anguilla anguilla TaxID=7936 RepID=A0A0E9S2H1_ANGAN
MQRESTVTNINWLSPVKMQIPIPVFDNLNSS